MSLEAACSSVRSVSATVLVSKNRMKIEAKQTEKLKRHPGVHLTALPHKETSATKLHAAPYHSRGKIDQEESKIRKAPEWVEHFPTHSRHKFSIQNLGQSEEVMRQFYKGANGGKPYTTPKPYVEKLKAKNVFSGKEERRIAENIIKEELNRAKVAKFGRSAGTPHEANESGTDEEPSGAATPLTVEQSGYSQEEKTVNVDWSVNNNKVEEFFHGYDGMLW
ncbi:hypothetical protein GCK32_008981 [Trichostrongylus colubriformis]|uniref:Uncharacterized protein n=1 Tax=Trichostrongylus colubriformis TaxID=6319 RepID=A0AAN8F1T4_TRICO